MTDNCQLSYALPLPIRQWFNVFRFLLRVVPWGCYCGLIPKREESASIRLAITRHSTYTSLSQYFSEWLWKGTKGCIGNYNFAEKWNVLQARRNRGDWVGCSPPLRFLLNSIFDESKKIVLKWKIVQNHKTSWNSSKFIGFMTLLLTSTPEMVSYQ